MARYHNLLLNKVIDCLIDRMIGKHPHEEINLVAPRILQVAFVAKCKKRAKAPKPGESDHSFTLTKIHNCNLKKRALSCTENGVYNTKSGRIRLSLRDPKWKKVSERNNCTWNKTPCILYNFVHWCRISKP